MTGRNNIDEKINAALCSLDNIRPATPKPFFYTRLQSRLNQKPDSVWTKIYTFLATPSIAMAMICLVIVSDGMLLFKEEDTAMTPPEYSLSAQYQEFSLNSEEFYDYAFDENINADHQK
jgi:hypothetical protein